MIAQKAVVQPDCRLWIMNLQPLEETVLVGEFDFEFSIQDRSALSESGV